MRKYSEYKYSGVKWIGDIPKHWGITSFNRNFTYGKGLPITKADLLPEGIAVISYGQIHSKCNTGTSITDELVCRVSPSYLESNPQSLLRQNDFVFADTSEDIEGSGNCAFNDYNEPIFAGYHSVIARPINLAVPKYYAYLFRSSQWRSSIQTLVNGVKVYSISKGILKRSFLLTPPLAEQRAIVSYLDGKVGQIDTYVAKQTQQIELLKELKQAVIANAVTKGMANYNNHHTKLKQSGISWIGEIPEHWEVKKLRHLINIISIKNHPNETLLSVVREQGVIVRDLETDDNHNYIPEDLSGYKLIKEGQFVINKMKAWQGSYAVSSYRGIVSPAYYTCDLRLAYKDFFNIAIRSRAYVPFFTQYSKGIRVGQWDLSPIGLKEIPFFLPPLSEQRAIVSFIEAKTASINKLINAYEQQVERVKEYKQRLISDAVTGKMNVTDEQTQTN